MARNTLHFRPAERFWRLECWIAVLAGFLLGLPARAQEPIDPADRLPPELREKLLPTAKPLENEDRVGRLALVEALPGRFGVRDALQRAWVADGGVVLDTREKGLTLHYYAEGIKAMTTAD